MIASALVLTVIVALAGAVLCGVLPDHLPRRMAVTTTAAVTGIGVWGAAAGHGTSIHQWIGTVPWLDAPRTPPVFGVLLDPLGTILLVVVLSIGLLTVVFSTAYLREKNRDHGVPPREEPRYYFWLLLFIASMVGVAISPNFFQLFMFWEMTTVCSWALISFHQNDSSLRAGFKALIMTHVGGVFFLVGILVLFVATGSFEFAALAQLSGGVRAGVFVCLMIAAWAKAAQVPFHTWLPDAMEAPTPISAYLHAAAMVKAGVYLMARTASSGWAMPPELGLLLGVMALLSMLIALSFYFVQDDLKRLLAYSTIAHLGYVLLGVALGALGSMEGFRGGVLHIICHAFSKATLFFCVGSIAYMTGCRTISALRGLGKSMPLTAVAFFVGVLAVSGVPPFACFWSKFMILAGAMQLSGPLGPVVFVLVLGETLIAFAWLLHVAQKVFLGAPTLAAQINSDPPPAMSGTLVVLMIGCLAAPVIGFPLVEAIGR